MEGSNCSVRNPWISELDPPTKTGTRPRLAIDAEVVVAIDQNQGTDKSSLIVETIPIR